MSQRKYFLHLLFLVVIHILFLSNSHAQGVTPKREFRAVWVATVNNIDFPGKPTRSSIALKEQWKKLVEKFQELGFNALIVQIRPSGDAFYPTELAPWSKYLTGIEGIGPDKDFDPLKFMIEETHRQGMEFHAWMNPYRATMTVDSFNLAEENLFFKHRDWLVRYGRRFYFNPGLPEVREHIISVVSEVVKNYDVDAVHFDDYFYPYKIKNTPFPDSLLFQAKPGRFTEIDDWRRNNIDLLIEELFLQVKLIKPHVRLGISPFGVWRNKADDPSGSDTEAGVTAYDDVYADVVKWLRNGWIDYVVPQIYWNIGFEKADFEKLLRWWGSHTSDRHFYVGHAAYKVANNSVEAWSVPTEIPEQIKLARKNWKSQGSVFFSSNSVLNNPLGVRDSIGRYYRNPALLPELTDLEMKRPSPPKLKKIKSTKEGIRIRWTANKEDIAKLPAYYVVYRMNGFGAKAEAFEEAENILKISPLNSSETKITVFDETAEVDKVYTYVVTAVNKNNKESVPSNQRKVQTSEKGVKNVKKRPTNVGRSSSKGGGFLGSKKKTSFFD